MEESVHRNQQFQSVDEQLAAEEKTERIVLWRRPTGDIPQEEDQTMAALNALFAQLTGAGTAPPSPLSERERRVNGGGTSSVPVGSDGGSAARHGNGSGGLGGSSRDRAGGSSSTSDSLGVALTGSVVVFDPKNSEGDFETPQVSVSHIFLQPMRSCLLLRVTLKCSNRAWRRYCY